MLSKDVEAYRVDDLFQKQICVYFTFRFMIDTLRRHMFLCVLFMYGV